jgi:hypothetical protein
MIRLFRKRSPQHRKPSHRTEPLKLAEALVASAWGLDADQWRALTDHERAEARRTVTAAPRYVP